MGFFTKSTGETLNKTTVTGNFESQTDLLPIPDKTVTKVACTEAKWAEIDKLPNGETKRYVGERYINLRWDVIEGEYKGRVTFQKLYVNAGEPTAADKAKEMLAAIDFNAGGKIIAADREPTDMDLMSNLANKIMFVRQRVWGKTGEKQGNWIDAVQGKGTVQTKTSAPASQHQEPPTQPTDDEIPF